MAHYSNALVVHAATGHANVAKSFAALVSAKTRRVDIAIPQAVRSNAAKTLERREWLGRLPVVVRDLAQRWELDLEAPFDSDDVSASWVAPALRRGDERVVLKVGMPHMEGAQEIDGLRFWSGDPTVRLLEEDASNNAMLLERCVPGTALRAQPEDEQDGVIAGLLRRLWRATPIPGEFRPLSALVDYWSAETRGQSAQWTDRLLVEDGLRVMNELSQPSPTDVLLGTDVHAGNVLRAERAPWIVIDPKPFVGDAAYDATQHLINCRARVAADPRGTITRFADLLEVDAERVHLWLFARVAAEPRDWWDDDSALLARSLI